MNKPRKTAPAIRTLHRHYMGDNVQRQAPLELAEGARR